MADYEALQFIFNPLQLVSASETRIVFENSPDWNDNQTYTILEGSFTESGGAGAGFDGGAITKVIHAANDTGTTPIGEYTGDFPTFETFLASVDAIAAPYLQLADQAGWLDVEDLVGDGPSDASDTAVAFEHVSGGTVIFRGQNLNIDPTNFAGTITSLELRDTNGAVIQSSPLTPPMSLVDFINALEPSEAVTKALVPADHSFTSRIEQGDWLEVKGGAGDNTIIGSDGPESIEGAGGDDTITTGGGFDTIVYDLMFEPNIGHDVITDFMPGEDNITIVDPAGVSSLDDLDVTQDEDGNTIISGLPGTDGSITLEGVTKNLLTSQYQDWDDGSALSIFGRTVHHGQPDNNDLFASDAAEAFFLMEGLGTIYGDLATLDGDIISGFDASKNLFLTASEISRDQINVVQGSAILHFDTDSDGNTDNIVTLEGDFSDGDFMSVVDQGNTFITFETFLPELSEGQAVDGGDINGINNQKFLTGDGLTDFQVTLRDMGFAGYDNVLGAYEVDGAGQIVDARLLIDNVNADKTAQALVENVEAGHSVGFFIVQDAAEWAATLGPGDVLSFVNGDGAPANVSDGDTVRLAVNGTAVDETVFHSYDVGLNVDGVQHALSGVEVGGEAITVGFEDLTGGGDQDYEDVVFTVATVHDEVI